MHCPFCECTDTQVKDSRPSDDGLTVRRRRFCVSCSSRFKTVERVEVRRIKVIKNNGEIRDFSENKLFSSIDIATRKRNVSKEQIEAIVSTIIKNIQRNTEGDIRTSYIGEMVMDHLSRLDPVAYIRYASVHNDFSKIGDFDKFIRKIKGK